MKVSNCLIAGAVLAGLAACAPQAPPPEAIVHKSTGDFPIASTVTVPAGHKIVFLSGSLGSPATPDTPWGDTEAQSLAALTKIKASLEAEGLTFSDVVSMTVYLVADKSKATKDQPARMDFQGMMAAYTKFFGKDSGNPNLPTRSAVEVAGLAQPAALVEIEVTAAK